MQRTLLTQLAALLAALVLGLPARAEVIRLTVGVTSSCPYGLMS